MINEFDDSNDTSNSNIIGDAAMAVAVEFDSPQRMEVENQMMDVTTRHDLSPPEEPDEQQVAENWNDELQAAVPDSTSVIVEPIAAASLYSQVSAIATTPEEKPDESVAINLSIREAAGPSDNARRNLNFEDVAANATTLNFEHNVRTITYIQDDPFASCGDMRSELTIRCKTVNLQRMKDRVYSDWFKIREIPFRLLLLPRTENNDRTIGLFVDSDVNSALSWSCYVSLTFKLFSNIDDQAHVMRCCHNFNQKNSDWGFNNFIGYDVAFSPTGPYYANKVLLFEVSIKADVPRGLHYNSKQMYGMVGLKNQGATCYMNSLLQALFFTNKFRKIIYRIPTECDDNRSIPLALQQIFYQLEFAAEAVNTSILTKSFGWSHSDSLSQHDVQEFLRVLIENIELRILKSSLSGAIPSLFEGKTLSYIQCTKVEYKSAKSETFYDIQLNVKGLRNVYEALDDYISLETLDENNQYHAGTYGLQDAQKGVSFRKFPPVLHLHLLRFQYDPVMNCTVKNNSYFEFYEHINLDRYLDAETKDEEQILPASYTLHSVLVHTGDNANGHYVAYINPKCDGLWYKFDDDAVVRVTAHDAIDSNYGNDDKTDPYINNYFRSTNAYMLVYVCDNDAIDILKPVVLKDTIPAEVLARIKKARLEEKMIAKIESNSYFRVNVFTECSLENRNSHKVDMFSLSLGHDKFDILRSAPINEVYEVLCQSFLVDEMRLWPIHNFGKFLNRPFYVDPKLGDQKLYDLLTDGERELSIFVELVSPELPIDQTIRPFDHTKAALVFFRFYDSEENRLFHICYDQFDLSTTIESFVPTLNKKMGFADDTSLRFYDESAINHINHVPIIWVHDNRRTQLCDIGPKFLDTVVLYLIFEQTNNFRGPDIEQRPSCVDYFVELNNIVCVEFCNFHDMDAKFADELSLRSSYATVIQTIGRNLNYDEKKIQLFCYSPNVTPIKSTYTGHLSDLLKNIKYSQNRKIVYYQLLNEDLAHLELKSLFFCRWLSINMHDEKELQLYVKAPDDIEEILATASKHVELDATNGSGKLRIVEIKTHRLHTVNAIRSDEKIYETIYLNWFYRIEEIPRNQLNLDDSEFLMNVFHFYVSVKSPFGHPFLIKINAYDTFAVIGARIMDKMQIKVTEWMKSYQLVVVQCQEELIAIRNYEKSFNDYREFHEIIDDLSIGVKHMEGFQSITRNRLRQSGSLEKSIIMRDS